MDTEAMLKIQNFETSGFLGVEDINFDIFSGLELNNTGRPPNPNDTSVYSTNCSSKNTPEHYALGLEDSKETDEESQDQKIPKVKKMIYKKYYEPIVDTQQSIIYRFEENPEEYKKARKRMQNRESASRVRSRKRTQMEQVEDEMKDLKRKNEELMLINASLTAENNLLKQQVSFLQKLVVKSGPENEVQPAIQSSDSDSKYILPITQERIRSETPRSISKHFSILGIFTVLIFVLTGGWSKNDESMTFSEQFKGRFDRGVKSFDQDAIDYLLGQYEIWKTVSFAAKYIVLGVYAGYVCWILYQFLIKKYVKLKIKEI